MIPHKRPKEREKFERTMKALFRVPKDEVKDEIKRKIRPRKQAKRLGN